MIDYEDNFSVLIQVHGSVIPKAVIFSLPSAIIAIVLQILEDHTPEFRKDTGIDDITESQLWNACTAVIAILLAFRTRQALGRFWEGTGLLHQMRGEWFDAASCLVSFSRDALVRGGKIEQVWEFRHTLIRLMSLMHGTALDEISDNPGDTYEVLDIHGLDTETLMFLKDCKENYGFNRVEALQHMIQVLVTHNHHAAVLTIPPPILSRVYQTLSRGLVNLLNAKKIKDTMFPFPYAQIIFILLIFHTVFTPVMMTQIIKKKVTSAVLSFMPILGMYCVNFIASELEMPFGSDKNDLPLKHFQVEMNATLLMLIHEKTDHLPHTSGSCVHDFNHLAHFARASLVKKDGDVESNSQSFMKKDFFKDQVDCTYTYSGSSTSLDTTKIVEPKREEKEAEKKKEEKPPSAAPQEKLSIEPAPAVVGQQPKKDEKIPDTQLTSGSAANSPPEAQPPPLHVEITPEAQNPTAIVRAPASSLPVPVVQRPISVPSIPIATNKPGMSELVRNCCFPAPPRSPTNGQMVWSEYSHGGAMVMVQQEHFLPSRNMPQEIASLGDNWLRMTSVLIEELRNNTAIIQMFNNSFPTELKQHSQVMMSFTEAVLRTLDTVQKHRGPSENSTHPSLEQVGTSATQAGGGFPAV